MRPYNLVGLETPSKPAIVMGSGDHVSYSELERRVNQRAHALRTSGLVKGDTFAFVLENGPEFLATALAGLRSGLIVIPVSTLLTVREISVIVEDSGSKLLIISPKATQSFVDLAKVPGLPNILCTGAPANGYKSWTDLCGVQLTTPLEGEVPGSEMLYSSGTTGRPKGIVYRGLVGRARGGVSEAVMEVAHMFGLSNQTVYLCPAPLYHSAPYAWSIAVLRLGGTLVLMERFDPQNALQLIAEYRVGVAQFVPTHFVRMLKLPRELRESYDISSLQMVIHSAAPCPIEVKRQVIDWVGPIVFEYFGSSEQYVLTMIGSQDWLDHPGSVGRCVNGRLHICDENGIDVSTGTVGVIYSEGGMDFSYHNDPVRTAASRNQRGWTTVGDVGYLDDEGFLYLTDRSAFLIITGGVNVYPQEIENLLVVHPAVADAAVVGVPDTEMGEIVTAVVQLINPDQGTPEFATELRLWLREQLSGAKVPRHIVFTNSLPRLPTGKMKKHLILAQLAAE
jgi:long-chain acyl-CoA synthetase